MKSLKCEICIVDVHRASYLKHLRSKKHLENEKKMKSIYQNVFLKSLLIIKIKIYILP